MTELSRKERQKREREALILAVSRKVLLEKGYVGFNMDHIAKLTEYSKGTIYQHFTCKEAIMARLYLTHMETLLALLHYCQDKNVVSRLRMRLLQHGYSIIAEHFAEDFEMINSICASPFREKATPEILAIIDQQEETMLNGVIAMLKEAVSKSELSLPEGMRYQELAFGIWALSFGAVSLQVHSCSVEKLGISKSVETLSQCMDVFLDGLNWRPLSTELNFSEQLKDHEQAFLALVPIDNNVTNVKV